MKEIGGYIELEHYQGRMLHEDGIRLDSGRNCLAYLILAKKIKKIALPYYMCDSVINLCRQYDVEVFYYHIERNLRVDRNLHLDSDVWLYVTNYFGQYTADEIKVLHQCYRKMIVDNAQAYFDLPIDGIDTLYTCRKFFGVPDGGILFTDTKISEEIPRSESFMHMAHILGRYERNGSSFFRESVQNNERFDWSPLFRMSRLTENLLRSIDYEFVKRRRTENYLYLHEHLKHINQLELREVEGAFAYPLLIDNGAELKKALIREKIYVPTLWPNVLNEMAADSLEYRLANDILPIPCDQRYGEEEMVYICNLIDLFLN